MDMLNFADNLVRLRRQKKVTQEQLADFAGVTKASVSKWETRQSLPDVLLLPRLAAFFDITIDQLLGYEPQLSQEQIQKVYQELAGKFAQGEFAKAMESSRKLVREYYSCYPLLFQICILWLNHFMIADNADAQNAVLSEIVELCDHIIADCGDIRICEDTVILRATVQLQLGKAQEAIEALEEVQNPYRLRLQSDAVLIQAYMLAGQKDAAERYTQISMFLHVLSLVEGALQYLVIHSDDNAVCEETIRRVEQVAAAYRLEALHPHSIATFRYQAALVYCQQGKKQEAISMLKRYGENVEYLLEKDHLVLHEDAYFNRLQGWYEQSGIGAEAPRKKSLIAESFRQSLYNPVFSVLEGNEEFAKLRKKAEKKEGRE